MKPYLVGLGILWLLATSVLSGWLLYSRFTQTNRARVANAHIWHAVVCDIEKKTVASKQAKKANAQDVNDFLNFYDHLLVVDAHAAPCGLPRRAR